MTTNNTVVPAAKKNAAQTNIEQHFFIFLILLHEFLETCRNGKFYLQLFVSDGMEEAELIGVKGDTSYRVDGATVFIVSGNGMFQVLHMDTNLILASCVEFELDERHIVGTFECAVVCDGILSAVVDWRRIGDKHTVVHQPRGDGAVVFLHLALADGDVATVGDNVLPVVDEGLLYVDGLGEDEESGSLAVKTVDGVDGSTFLLSLHVLVEHTFHGLLPLSAGRAGEDAVLLLDNNDESVLVDDAHQLVVELMYVAFLGNLHELSGLQRGVELCGYLMVYIHHLVCQQFLCTCAADTVFHLHDERQQLVRLLYDVVVVACCQFMVVIVLSVVCHCINIFYLYPLIEYAKTR